MKLRLIVSYEVPTPEDGKNLHYAIVDSDYNENEASNASINRKYTRSSREKLYRFVNKHTHSNNNIRYETVLVNVPDEIVFQFMMDGASDNDYIAYNLISEKISISNNHYSAYSSCNIDGDSVAYENNYVKRYGGAGAYGSQSNSDKLMFDWYCDTEKKKTREEYIIQVQGDLYGNFYKEVKENIIHSVNLIIENNYLNLTNNAANVMNLNSSPSNPIAYGMESAVSSQSHDKLSMDTTQVLFLLENYVNDGKYWKIAENVLTSHEVEVLKEIYYAAERDND